MHKLKYINLNQILDLENYTRSLRNWEEIYCTATLQLKRDSFFKEQFDKYLDVVKPIIHPNSMLVDLKNVPNLAFYTTEVTVEQLHRLTKAISELKNWDILVGEPESSLIIPSVDQLVALCPKREEIHKVELRLKPGNLEVNFWNTTLPIEPIKIVGPVVHSKKVASTVLGMPTANFSVDQELNTRLLNYPNGIYSGTFKFLSCPEKQYRAVCSLGINMHYENQVYSRKFQAYVYHQFSEDFYGEEVQVELKRLIRLEGLFKNFDSFLNAMSNDVWVGRLIQT